MKNRVQIKSCTSERYLGEKKKRLLTVHSKGLSLEGKLCALYESFGLCLGVVAMDMVGFVVGSSSSRCRRRRCCCRCRCRCCREGRNEGRWEGEGRERDSGEGKKCCAKKKEGEGNKKNERIKYPQARKEATKREERETEREEERRERKERRRDTIKRVEE